jgi:hypothetical protein
VVVPADVVIVDLPLPGTELGRRAVERFRDVRGEGGLALVGAASVDEVSEFADRVVYLARDGSVLADGGPSEVARVVQAHRDDTWSAALASEAARRDLPLSPDAARYLEFLKVLVGPERADEARRRAVAMAAPVAERIEWTGIAKHGGFDRAEHAAVVERLRTQNGA